MAIEISIWGARGSISVCNHNMMEVGTHTPCVMVKIEDRALIFDAGNGIITLGNKLLEDGVNHVDLFLSHVHYDHIIGLPFFAPLFNETTPVTIHSSGADGYKTEELVAKFMCEPFFPVSSDVFSQATRYKTFIPGDAIDLGQDIIVRSTLLNHPGRTVGFRLDTSGRSFCYVSDFEHDDGASDNILIDFMKGADFALIDCCYTPEEYESARGFGHSHWRASGNLCKRSGVKSWRLFHHQYMRTDDEIARIEREAKAVFPNAAAAREGDIILL